MEQTNVKKFSKTVKQTERRKRALARLKIDLNLTMERVKNAKDELNPKHPDFEKQKKSLEEKYQRGIERMKREISILESRI